MVIGETTPQRDEHLRSDAGRGPEAGPIAAHRRRTGRRFESGVGPEAGGAVPGGGADAHVVARSATGRASGRVGERWSEKPRAAILLVRTGATGRLELLVVASAATLTIRAASDDSGQDGVGVTVELPSWTLQWVFGRPRGLLGGSIQVQIGLICPFLRSGAS